MGWDMFVHLAGEAVRAVGWQADIITSSASRAPELCGFDANSARIEGRRSSEP